MPLFNRSTVCPQHGPPSFHFLYKLENFIPSHPRPLPTHPITAAPCQPLELRILIQVFWSDPDPNILVGVLPGFFCKSSSLDYQNGLSDLWDQELMLFFF